MELSYTVEDIKKVLGQAEQIGSTTERICSIGSLDQAKTGDMSFLGNSKYKNQVPDSKASLILVPMDYEGEPKDNQVFLKIENPSLALTHICAAVERFLWPTPPAGVHPTAFIDPAAEVAASASIGAMCVIEAGARVGERSILSAGVVLSRNTKVGDDSWLMANVSVMDYCVIGNGVRLHPGVVIGGDGFGYVPQDGKHVRVPQIGHVVIEDYVEIGSNSTIDRARFDVTRIAEGTKIDNLVQIGHNVQIGKHCIIVSQTGIAGSTTVEDYCIIGGQVGVAGHLTIGKGAQIGSQSGVNCNIEAGAKVRGAPPTPITQALRVEALKKRLPEFFKRLKHVESLLESGNIATN